MTKYELIRVDVEEHKEALSYVRTYTNIEDAVNKCNYYNRVFLTEPAYYKVERFIYAPYG